MQRVALAVTALMFVMVNQTHAQSTTSVPFLLIAPDARSEGMGGSGTGLADDASAIYWNVGGLGLLNGDHATATLSTGLPEFGADMTYYSLGYSHYVEQWRSGIAASITYFNVIPFYYSFSFSYPTVLMSWTTKDLAVTLGYGVQISDGLSIGANIRYTYSKLAPFGFAIQGGSGQSSIVDADLGLLYRPQRFDLPLIGNFSNRFGLGVTLTNFGPNLFYEDVDHAEPLPMNLRLGCSIHLIKSDRNNLYFVLDVTKRMVRYFGGDSVGIDPVDSAIIHSPRGFDSFPKSLITSWSNGSVFGSFTFNMGIEYWLGQPRAIALRVGYLEQYFDFGGRHFFTLGAGIRHKIFAFDLAYIARVKGDSPLFNHYRFSVALNWGGQSNF